MTLPTVTFQPGLPQPSTVPDRIVPLLVARPEYLFDVGGSPTTIHANTSISAYAIIAPGNDSLDLLSPGVRFGERTVFYPMDRFGTADFGDEPYLADAVMPLVPPRDVAGILRYSLLAMHPAELEDRYRPQLGVASEHHQGIRDQFLGERYPAQEQREETLVPQKAKAVITDEGVRVLEGELDALRPWPQRWLEAVVAPKRFWRRVTRSWRLPKAYAQVPPLRRMNKVLFYSGGITAEQEELVCRVAGMTKNATQRAQALKLLENLGDEASHLSVEALLDALDDNNPGVVRSARSVLLKILRDRYAKDSGDKVLEDGLAQRLFERVMDYCIQDQGEEERCAWQRLLLHVLPVVPRELITRPAVYIAKSFTTDLMSPARYQYRAEAARVLSDLDFLDENVLHSLVEAFRFRHQADVAEVLEEIYDGKPEYRTYIAIEVRTVYVDILPGRATGFANRVPLVKLMTKIAMDDHGREALNEVQIQFQNLTDDAGSAGVSGEHNMALDLLVMGAVILEGGSIDLDAVTRQKIRDLLLGGDGLAGILVTGLRLPDEYAKAALQTLSREVITDAELMYRLHVPNLFDSDFHSQLLWLGLLVRRSHDEHQRL